MLETIDGKKHTFTVIRAVYENGHSSEEFERELDMALYREVSMVIIEPEPLGESTWRWIQMGNRLHKTSVIADLASCVTSAMVVPAYSQRLFHQPMRNLLDWTGLSLSVVGVGCAAAYFLSWQCDPCSNYQVETNWHKLPSCIPYSQLTSSSPVVLVRRNDKHRRYLHNTLAMLVIATGAYRLYRNFKA